MVWIGSGSAALLAAMRQYFDHRFDLRELILDAERLETSNMKKNRLLLATDASYTPITQPLPTPLPAPPTSGADISLVILVILMSALGSCCGITRLDKKNIHKGEGEEKFEMITIHHLPGGDRTNPTSRNVWGARVTRDLWLCFGPRRTDVSVSGRLIFG